MSRLNTTSNTYMFGTNEFVLDFVYYNFAILSGCSSWKNEVFSLSHGSIFDCCLDSDSTNRSNYGQTSEFGT